MSTIRKNITIQSEIVERAEQVMRVRAIDNFSKMLDILIREEYERRQPAPAMLARAAETEQELRAGIERKLSTGPTSPAELPTIQAQQPAVPTRARSRRPQKNPSPRRRARK